MSESKRLISFRDLAKAKPQAKENQKLDSAIASAIAISEPSTATPPAAIEEPIAELPTEPPREAIPEAITIPLSEPIKATSTIALAARPAIAIARPAVEASEISFPEPSAKPPEGRVEPYQTLEATHTGSEQKLYG